ncbi:hypothetical protein Tco_0866382, partial [Tanacetum coccineum]
DEEEVSYDDNEVTEVKALMALTDEERVSVGKESAKNGEWIKISMKKHHTGQGESSSRSRPSRPVISFPSCIHCGYNDHQSDDCIYYPTCEICRSYDHDTHDHNKVISLIRGIKPINPQNVTKNCETCASNVHTTADHNDIEWSRKREVLQAKKAESFKESKIESSSALRSKTPIKGGFPSKTNHPDPNCFDLKGYSDSDYARCNMDRKSTSSACQLLEDKL